MPDYIVIGGGSAGSTLAGRLSEDPTVSVVLFEAGPRDWNPFIHLPVGYYKTTKGPLTWGLHLAPQGEQGGITPEITQARVLGGGSSVNAQVYIRGTAADYDRWADEGAPGWAYKDVLPFFKRAEGNERLSGEFHGTDGPLRVSDQRFTHPLSKAFVRACQEYGLPYNSDFNGESQMGAGLYQTTNYNGRRCSAAVAYLRGARKRRNLSIRTGVMVQRIVVEAGRAVAVEIIANGKIETVRAEREIILTAGAIHSPKILLLSGIGPASHLAEVGIKPVHDLPGVGQNLQDHLDVFMMYNIKGSETYDVYKKLHRQVLPGMQYAAFRNGPVSGTVVEGGAFCSGPSGDPNPEMQYHFLAGTGVEAITAAGSSGNGCTLNAYFLRPKSRGSVTLRSADAAAQPVIDPNYLSDPYDLERTIESIKIGQEIMSQPSMAKFVQNEFMPGPGTQTRADYERYVREQARSGYHPVGTCKMGEGDDAVVDMQLRVHGIAGLRVADASIMPSLVSGNTNAPTIMIGERASDFLLGNRAPALVA